MRTCVAPDIKMAARKGGFPFQLYSVNDAVVEAPADWPIIVTVDKRSKLI